MVKGWLAVRYFLLYLQLRIAVPCRCQSVYKTMGKQKERGWWSHQQRLPCSVLPISRLLGEHRWEQATVVNPEYELPHSPGGMTVPNKHYTNRIKYFRSTPNFFKAQREQGCFGTGSRMQHSHLQGGRTTLQIREMLSDKFCICLCFSVSESFPIIFFHVENQADPQEERSRVSIWERKCFREWCGFLNAVHKPVSSVWGFLK